MANALSIEQRAAKMDAVGRTTRGIRVVRSGIILLLMIALLVGAVRIVLALIATPQGAREIVGPSRTIAAEGSIAPVAVLAGGDGGGASVWRDDGSAKPDVSADLSALLREDAAAAAENDNDADATDNTPPPVDPQATEQAETMLAQAFSLCEREFDYAAAADMYERVMDLKRVDPLVRERAARDYARCLLLLEVVGRAHPLSERYQFVRFQTRYGLTYEGYVDLQVDLTTNPLPYSVLLRTFDGRLVELAIRGLDVSFIRGNELARLMGERVRAEYAKVRGRESQDLVSPLDYVDLAMFLRSLDRVIDSDGVEAPIAAMAHSAIGQAMEIDEYLLDTLMMRDDAAYARLLHTLQQTAGQITPSIARIRDELFAKRPNAWYFQGDPERLFVILERELQAAMIELERPTPEPGDGDGDQAPEDEFADPEIEQFRRENEDPSIRVLTDAGQERYDAAVAWDRQTLPDGRRSDQEIDDNLARAINEYQAAITLWQEALDKTNEAGGDPIELQNLLIAARRGIFSARKRKRI